MGTLLGRSAGGWAVALLCLVVGAAAGFAVGRAVDDAPVAAPATPPGDATPVRGGGYRFISPLIECEPGSARAKGELLGVQGALRAAVDQALREGRVQHVSVYFRDLTNGPWFGINERERFTPASLLKVPILMAWLRLAEDHPELLEQRIVFEGSGEAAVPTIPSSSHLRVGATYSLAELVERMIVYSDNDATQVLLANVDEAVLVQTYTELGFPLPTEQDLDPEMTVKQYAAAFRVLYNATLLGRAMSERALELLTRAEFRDGLVAGVPEGVPVAHKFGERSLAGSPARQLHECGIVYVPAHPYLLCVMTRGEDVAAQTELIAALSRAAYMSVQEHAAR